MSLITGTASGMGARPLRSSLPRKERSSSGATSDEAGNDETVRMVEAAGFAINADGTRRPEPPRAAKSSVDESAAIHRRIDVVFNNPSAPRYAPCCPT